MTKNRGLVRMGFALVAAGAAVDFLLAVAFAAWDEWSSAAITLLTGAAFAVMCVTLVRRSQDPRS